MWTEYEWDVETVALDDGEVLDHDHAETLADCLNIVKRHPAPKGTRYCIVLVRDDDEGRQWAYLTDAGALPEFFQDAFQRDGSRVPQRFHRETARARTSTAVHDGKEK